MMKRILAPVVSGSIEHLPFHSMLSLANDFDAIVAARLYQPRADEHSVDPMSWGLTTFASQEGLMNSEIDQARLEIERELARLGLASVGTRFVIDRRSLNSWKDLGRISRVYDLSIVSRDGLAEHATAAMEQLLFESGRPMLLVPAHWPHSIGACVAIAWNRSTETARLVGHSLDLLRRAREVHVIDIEDWFVEGPDGAQLIEYLSANDVSARLHAVAGDRSEFGGRILQETHAVGADLLLKGAYTQKRITQVIFGGATRDILRDAYLPVLFAH